MSIIKNNTINYIRLYIVYKFCFHNLYMARENETNVINLSTLNGYTLKHPPPPPPPLHEYKETGFMLIEMSQKTPC